jgi:hypothetical protein
MEIGDTFGRPATLPRKSLARRGGDATEKADPRRKIV